MRTACAPVSSQLKAPLKGSCPEATIALALTLQDSDVPVCLCYGTVAVEGKERDHAWLRLDGMIVDPTL